MDVLINDTHGRVYRDFSNEDCELEFSGAVSFPITEFIDLVIGVPGKGNC